MIEDNNDIYLKIGGLTVPYKKHIKTEKELEFFSSDKKTSYSVVIQTINDQEFTRLLICKKINKKWICKYEERIYADKSYKFFDILARIKYLIK